MDSFLSLNVRATRSAADRVHYKPQLSELLRMLNADVVFHRAAGDFVYYRDGCGDEVEVLDVVGGYGVLLLGHAHPVLTAEAVRILSASPANHVQGSVRRGASVLAAELSRRANGDYCVVFANSGAEGVEAALKHALLETRGRTFVALERGFHGKTLGAVQMSGNPAYREPFALSGWDVVRVPPNDRDALETAFRSSRRPAGFLYEPVQGEGGVHPLNADFLQRAAELCAEHNVPLIADECQTGLGRTGEFLASTGLGVRPDYIILSKALGGGIAKVAAVLIDRRRYVPDFDWLHTSTFAGDEFSSAVALKTLELLTPEAVAGCRDKGAWLLASLRGLQQRHPQALADVRGAGLMIGLELRRTFPPAGVLLRHLAAHGFLGLVVSAYLLRVHRIRAAPTLSDPFTIRLQPSALIAREQLERVVAACEDVCRRLERNDVVGLTRFLLTGDNARRPVVVSPHGNGEGIVHDPLAFRRRRRKRAVRHAGWLFHLADAGDLARLDPQLAELASEEREAYAGRIAPFCRPVLMNPVDIRSAAGGDVRLFPILLPVTSRWIKEQLHARNRAALQVLVEQGIDAAVRLGCSTVSLGQLTSTLTRQGRTLAHRPIGLTTGNSYTAALTLRAVAQAIQQRGLDPAASVLAVVGAAGNIGRICVEALAPRFRRTVVIGSARRSSWPRLQAIAEGRPRVECAALSGVREADVVICAASSVEAMLGPEHFSPGAIVCDLSVPAAVERGGSAASAGLHLIEGGVGRLPCGEAIDIPGFPLAAGHVYGCLAEGLALAWEGVRDQHFTGPVTESKMQQIEQMAMRHGLELATAPAADGVTPEWEQAHVSAG